MKVQTKLITYFPPIEQKRFEKREQRKRELREYIPTCSNCTKRRFCNKQGDEALRCLKRRIFLAINFKYHLFEIDPYTFGFKEGVREFYKILKRKDIDKIGKDFEQLGIPREYKVKDGEWNEKGFYVDKKQTLLVHYSTDLKED